MGGAKLSENPKQINLTRAINLGNRTVWYSQYPPGMVGLGGIPLPIPFFAMNSPFTILVLPFDPEHWAGIARQYAGKYASKPETL